MLNHSFSGLWSIIIGTPHLEYYLCTYFMVLSDVICIVLQMVSIGQVGWTDLVATQVRTHLIWRAPIWPPESGKMPQKNAPYYATSYCVSHCTKLFSHWIQWHPFCHSNWFLYWTPVMLSFVCTTAHTLIIFSIGNWLSKSHVGWEGWHTSSLYELQEWTLYYITSVLRTRIWSFNHFVYLVSFPGFLCICWYIEGTSRNCKWLHYTQFLPNVEFIEKCTWT